jgi:hypothetical protein
VGNDEFRAKCISRLADASPLNTMNFARYSIMFLIGIGVTLAWQSYSDEAMQMVRTKAPSLASLLPVAKPPPDSRWSNAAAASPPQLAQQFEVNLVQQLLLGLGTVRRSVEQVAIKVDQLAAKQEQLAAKQDQMVQNIATLQSFEQEISKKLSSRAVAPRKPPQPAAQSSATQSSPVPLAPPPTEPIGDGDSGRDQPPIPH